MSRYKVMLHNLTEQRFAAHQHGSDNVRKWNSMTMDLLDLPVPQDWVVPLWTQLAEYLDSEGGLLGGGCQVEKRKGDRPVVTYINR